MRNIHLIHLACAATISLLASGPVQAQQSAKADEVIAFVNKAVAHVDAVGEEKAFADFSNKSGEWVKDDLYIFCHSLEGVNVAHGGNPGLIGKNVLGFKDPDGVLVNVLILDKIKADGKGWVEYKWPNPITKKIDMKAVYSTNVHGKYACGSGYYK